MRPLEQCRYLQIMEQFLFNEIKSGIFLSKSCFLIIPICLSGITVSSLNALGLEVKGFINYVIHI